MPLQPEIEEKVEAWLFENYEWLHALDGKAVMERIGLELAHGIVSDRSVEDSLTAAGNQLRREFDVPRTDN